MGSKLSKAVRRPRVKATTSFACAVPAKSPENWAATNERQEQIPSTSKDREPRPDFNGAPSPHEHHEPSAVNAPGVTSASTSQPTQNSGNSEETRDCDSANSAMDLSELPDTNEVSPPPDPEPVKCIACTEDVSRVPGQAAIEPCANCGEPYCVECIKQMFLDACTDMLRMPPKCCKPIALYHARPYMTDEQAALFRDKYEEWRTPQPFYCPVPKCSAFIPERLLPRKSKPNAKGKERVDSAMGAPTPPIIACPNCETAVCSECRNRAHPDAPCEILDFGVDKQTAELLQEWGYKRCPKCGSGVKRMFGCNHMECLCGAQFCWGCLQNYEVCGGGCYQSEDEYSDEEPDPEDDDEESEEQSQSPDEASQPGAPGTPDSTTSRINLDGRSARYWEHSGLDFGDEPINNGLEHPRHCSHDFVTASIELADALNRTPVTTTMECLMCWTPVQPVVDFPPSINTHGIRTVTSRVVDNSTRVRERCRSEDYVAPSLLSGSEGGRSAPNLPLSASRPSIWDMPAPTPGTITDGCVIDTLGNNVSSTSAPIPQRRASMDAVMPDVDAPWGQANDGAGKSVRVVNLAYECDDCALIVCGSCREELVGSGNW